MKCQKLLSKWKVFDIKELDTHATLYLSNDMRLTHENKSKIDIKRKSTSFHNKHKMQWCGKLVNLEYELNNDTRYKSTENAAFCQ